MKLITAIMIALVATIGMASADMPSVLVGAIKDQQRNLDSNISEMTISPSSIMMTLTVPATKTALSVLDRDEMVYNVYTLVANIADAIGTTAASIGVDHGNPAITIHVIDNTGAMVMYYTAADPLSMTPTTLSEDIAANLVIT